MSNFDTVTIENLYYLRMNTYLKRKPLNTEDFIKKDIPGVASGEFQ